MKQSVNLAIRGLLVTLMVAAVPAGARAAAADRPDSGLFGEIRLGAGGASIRPSGLEVLDDNENRDNLESKGKKRTEDLLLLGAELGYTFAETGTTLLAAINTEGPFSLSLGHEFGGVGELILSARYEKSEVWQDPYLIGANRSRTDAESRGFAMDWIHIMGSGAHLFFEQRNVDVEDDLIGRVEPGLRRDGKDTTVGIGYVWNLATAGVVNPSLSHTRIDREGAGNSGDSYGVEVEHVLGVGRLTFATALAWKHTDFDAVHPVFQQKRDETTYGISELISLAEPFSIKGWYLFGVMAFENSDSNITFFDSSSFLSGAGIGTKF